ncbi:hypothetical protein D1AOALGA4SA_11492 [Olavius algarvensis Delta 1 endosymbiont]|nr:hypothetical protein D1AOALGA4SA_11492 [Olavius algarvensis Delta 1 endosymbiont]
MNISSKTDTKYSEGGDITLLSGIITKSIYWQEIVRRESVKCGADLEHIINLVGVQRISIYHKLKQTRK